MKSHELETMIKTLTGLPVFVESDEKGHYLEITVLGDQPERVEPTTAALQNANIPFRKKPKGKQFAGQSYRIPIKNVGTAFQADWEFEGR